MADSGRGDARPAARLALLSLAIASFVPETVLALSYVDSSSGLEVPGLDGGDTELELADVNLDGHLDLVSVGDHGNPLVNTNERGIMVWFGDGLGGWTHTQFGHLGYGGVAVGDVNGDGLPDVAYGIHHNYSSTDLGDQLLEVALGDGTGLAWTPWDDGLAREGQDWGLFATDLGDLDGDGDLDVGSTGFGASDGFQVYLNRGDGSWERSFGYLGGNSDHVFCFGDIDGDGLLDVATAKAEGTVWLGDGEGFFTGIEANLPPLDPHDWRKGPSLGDVDADGRDDLAWCDDAGNAQVWLWRNGTWLDMSANVPDTGTCDFTQLRDMNGDGAIDLVTAGDRNVRVFAGDGTGAAWLQLTSFTLPDSPGDVVAFRVGGDVDHNGFPDMAVVDEKTISLFNTENVLHVFRETTPATAVSAALVRPGPGRTLHAGAVTFIDWSAAVPITQTATVSLDLSVSGPAGPWQPVAAGLPDNGRHQWLVPNQRSQAAHLRVTVTTSADEEAVAIGAAFTIARKPDPVRLQVNGDTVSWTDALGRDRYNVYRGDWSRFVATGEYTQDPAAEPGAARFCDLTATAQADPFTPAPGALAFYLVSGYRLMEDGQEPGVAVPLAEGALGQDAGARTRPSGSTCPRP